MPAYSGTFNNDNSCDVRGVGRPRGRGRISIAEGHWVKVAWSRSPAPEIVVMLIGSAVAFPVIPDAPILAPAFLILFIWFLRRVRKDRRERSVTFYRNINQAHHVVVGNVLWVSANHRGRPIRLGLTLPPGDVARYWLDVSGETSPPVDTSVHGDARNAIRRDGVTRVHRMSSLTERAAEAGIDIEVDGWHDTEAPVWVRPISRTARPTSRDRLVQRPAEPLPLPQILSSSGDDDEDEDVTAVDEPVTEVNATDLADAWFAEWDRALAQPDSDAAADDEAPPETSPDTAPTASPSSRSPEPAHTPRSSSTSTSTWHPREPDDFWSPGD